MQTGSLNVDKIKPYLLPIIALVVLIVLVPLVIMPWIGEVRTNYANYNDRKTKLTEMQVKADKLEKMDATANLNTLQTEVEPAIPSQADPSGVLGTLEQLAYASGTTPKGVQFAAAATAAPVAAAAGAPAAGTSVATNITVEGPYANVVSFVTQSESIRRVVGLTSLHITASQVPGVVTATFDVVAPYQAVPTDLGSTDQPLPELTAAKTITLKKVTSLTEPKYAATPIVDIIGKQNPFN